MYVIECAGLYIKDDGFTESLAEAKRFKTRWAAMRECVYPWTVKYTDA